MPYKQKMVITLLIGVLTPTYKGYNPTYRVCNPTYRVYFTPFITGFRVPVPPWYPMFHVGRLGDLRALLDWAQFCQRRLVRVDCFFFGV